MLGGKSNINIGNFQLRGKLIIFLIFVIMIIHVQAPSNSLLWIRAEVQAPEDPLPDTHQCDTGGVLWIPVLQRHLGVT